MDLDAHVVPQHFVRLPNLRDPVGATTWMAANPQRDVSLTLPTTYAGSLPLSISGTTPAFLGIRKRGGRFDDLRDKLKTDGPIEGERVMKAPTTLAKLLLIAVVTGAATTGCATRGTSLSRGVESRRQTAVRVRNDNWSDVKVYLVHASGAMPVRLGTVTSMSTLWIPLRGAVASQLTSEGSLRFEIRPLGSRRGYMTHSVFMAPAT